MLPFSQVALAHVCAGWWMLLPKPLSPVLGRPFLFYLLDMLSLRGARSVTLCSGYMADFIQQKTGSEWTRSPLTKLRLSPRKQLQPREALCHWKSTGLTLAGEHWQKNTCDEDPFPAIGER
jgi:hypothetical protein